MNVTPKELPRVVFRFEGQNAVDVDSLDDHSLPIGEKGFKSSA